MIHQLRKFFALSFLVCVAIVANATEPPYVHGEIMVQTIPGKKITEVLRALEFVNGQETGAYIKSKVSEPMHVWLIGFDENKVDEKTFLNAARTNTNVSVAQFNHITQKRLVPDDTNFGQQWQYVNTGQGGGLPGADIDADSAWDITTGGLTPLGDTIVVCVVDDGLDLTHTDFGDNLWINHAEIPDNNIDDDNNGYVDDFLGWNADDNDDDISGGGFGGGHGTPVAGIVGAKGNNNHGVAGVNWTVKLMIVVGGGDEAQAVAAYSYPFVMRKRYNQTNGAEGAFVVATNSSWGINNGQPADAPLWCAMYDSLGSVGILSAGATANADFNIDVTGDLPTACPSDWLITVTNTGNTDLKQTQAGYGINTIDLGAPGQGTYTTADNNSYGGFGGTSGATPHVAGTIGLLYSAPCYSFAVLAKANPAAAALAVKNYIMNGSDPNASLNNITVSGGRLNVFGALNELLDNCVPGGCISPFSLSVNNIQENEVNVSWLGAPGSNSYVLEYRVLNGSWNAIDSATSPFVLDNLLGCTTYEFRVLARCDTDTSLYSEIYTFITDGCCDAPTSLTAAVSGVDGGTASWLAPDMALSYNVRYKPVNGNDWDTTNTTGLTTTFSGLDHCTVYEVQVQTVCDTGLSPFTASVTFQTGDCNCSQSNYCVSSADDATSEWIARVVLGSLDHSSASNGGYADFSTYTTDIQIDSAYTIQLTPGYSGSAFTERFAVWVDWNRNGSYESPAERMLTTGGVTATASGTITIPANASLGSTGIRVSMKYQGLAAVCDLPADFDFGEVEDYCVNLVMKDTSSNPNPGFEELAWQSSVKVYPNPFNTHTSISFSNANNDNFTLKLMDSAGRLQRTLTTSNKELIIERDGLSVGLYIFELSSNNGKTFRGKLLIR